MDVLRLFVVLLHFSVVAAAHAQGSPRLRRKQASWNLQQQWQKQASSQQSRHQTTTNAQHYGKHASPERKAQTIASYEDYCELAIFEYGEPTTNCDCTNYNNGTVAVSCFYRDCESCYFLSDGVTEACAELYYEVTLQETENDRQLQETFYQECAEYTEGPYQGKTICYTESLEYDTINNEMQFECDLVVDDMSCNSCTDRCSFDCTNMNQLGMIDLCTVDSSTVLVPESKAYALFYRGVFEKCFQIIKRQPDGAVAGLLTDPHVTTFDGLDYDCQGAGEFIMAKSPQLEMQARFSAVGTADLPASVTTGIAIAIEQEPIFQVSFLPNAADFFCIPYFFLDGTEIFLFESTGDPGILLEVVEEGRIVVSFTRANVEITLLLRESETFGCFASTILYLPAELKENLKGLFGSPNLNPFDDWVDASGSNLPLPLLYSDYRFEAAHDYCTRNWCIRNEADSIFTYDSSESFSDYFQCDEPYNTTLLQQAISQRSVELSGICGRDQACLIDGTVGNSFDAGEYLQDRARLAAITRDIVSFPELNTRTPTMAPKTPQLVQATTSPTEAPKIPVTVQATPPPTRAVKMPGNVQATLPPPTMVPRWRGNVRGATMPPVVPKATGDGHGAGIKKDISYAKKFYMPPQAKKRPSNRKWKGKGVKGGGPRKKQGKGGNIFDMKKSKKTGGRKRWTGIKGSSKSMGKSVKKKSMMWKWKGHKYSSNKDKSHKMSSSKSKSSYPMAMKWRTKPWKQRMKYHKHSRKSSSMKSGDYYHYVPAAASPGGRESVVYAMMQRPKTYKNLPMNGSIFEKNL